MHNPISHKHAHISVPSSSSTSCVCSEEKSCALGSLSVEVTEDSRKLVSVKLCSELLCPSRFASSASSSPPVLAIMVSTLRPGCLLNSAGGISGGSAPLSSTPAMSTGWSASNPGGEKIVGDRSSGSVLGVKVPEPRPEDSMSNWGVGVAELSPEKLSGSL